MPQLGLTLASFSIPDHCSTLCVATSGFMQDGADVVQLGYSNDSNYCPEDEDVDSGYLCNLRYMIGTQIDDTRLH